MKRDAGLIEDNAHAHEPPRHTRRRTHSLDSAAGVLLSGDGHPSAHPEERRLPDHASATTVWVRQAMDEMWPQRLALRLELEESQQDEEESFVALRGYASSLPRLVALESGPQKQASPARDRAGIYVRRRDTAAFQLDAEAAAVARRSSEHVEEVVEEEDKQFWRELLTPN